MVKLVGSGPTFNALKVYWINGGHWSNRDRRTHCGTAGFTGHLAVLAGGRLIAAMPLFQHLGVVICRRHRHRAARRHGQRREQHRNGDQDREERAKTHVRDMRLGQ